MSDSLDIFEALKSVGYKTNILFKIVLFFNALVEVKSYKFIRSQI